MSKRIAVIAAVFLAACGTEKVADDAGVPGGQTPGGGYVPMNALLDSSTQVKVVLSSNKKISSPVYDDSDNPVSCTTNAECSPYTNATCQNLFCVVTSSVPETMYVDNFTKGAKGGFAVPCDGREYVVNVFGAQVTTGGNQILEFHKATFTMPTSSPCSATPTWADTDFAFANTVAPVITLPDVIYQANAAFPASYNVFTASVGGLVAPWSATNWTLTYGGQPGTTQYQGALAIFGSPSAASINFTGTFHLQDSLLGGTDTADLWYLPVTISNKATSGAGTVDLP